MPDGATYELGITALLYGEAQTARHYYIQNGADNGTAEQQPQELIDSYRVSGAEAAWQVWASDNASIICYSARQVLPSITLDELEFLSVAGSVAGESLAPKSKVLRQKQAPDGSGNFTRKSRSRNWYMGIPHDGTILGQLTNAKLIELATWSVQLRSFNSSGTPATVFDEANVTSRSLVGAPVTSAILASANVRPRVYNLRPDTLKVCGAS